MRGELVFFTEPPTYATVRRDRHFSIVKELCRLLEGEVSVQSELGTGSTFTVLLPWELEDKPRLDSPLMAGFEEFSKPRMELTPVHHPPASCAVPSAPEQGQGEEI